MIRVVVDTTVLVSAVISPAGPNAQIFEYERLQHLDKRRSARLRGQLEAAAIKVKSRGRLKISAIRVFAELLNEIDARHFSAPSRTCTFSGCGFRNPRLN